ncbi:MAG: aspartate aminotransferase family protein [Solirubrobacterales bacterium]|nr:aspartate aminotransferase family protein [Solirubrobacterales bacterium]
MNDKERVLDLARRYVVPHRVEVWDAFGTQLVIGRREGYRLWDLDGKELIDLHLNGGTFNLGHRNPEVIEAMLGATAELDIGNHHFASLARAELGEDLARLTPGDLTYSVFCASGGEANDVAIKTARRATGRRTVVGLAAGFHGRTGLAGAAGENSAARYFLSESDDFVTVPFGDLDAIDAALRADDVAAVIVETVPATYGFPIVHDGYLQGIRALCDRYGALYIADEVQTGLGRSGSLWAVQRFGVEPDVLVCGKGLSGGMYPIAAAVIGARVADWLHQYGWGHVSTFGGAEIGCRVAQKVLEITTRPSVRSNVDRLTSRLGADLAALAQRQSYLTEIRQTGLIIGLRVDHPDGAVYLQQELYGLGVWAIASGFDQSILQFKPGLLMDEPTVDVVLERLELALARAKDVDRPVPKRHRLATDSPR